MAKGACGAGMIVSMFCIQCGGAAGPATRLAKCGVKSPQSKPREMPQRFTAFSESGSDEGVPYSGVLRLFLLDLKCVR